MLVELKALSRGCAINTGLFSAQTALGWSISTHLDLSARLLGGDFCSKRVVSLSCFKHVLYWIHSTQTLCVGNWNISRCLFIYLFIHRPVLVSEEALHTMAQSSESTRKLVRKACLLPLSRPLSPVLCFPGKSLSCYIDTLYSFVPKEYSTCTVCSKLKEKSLTIFLREHSISVCI